MSALSFPALNGGACRAPGQCLLAAKTDVKDNGTQRLMDDSLVDLEGWTE